MVQSTQEEIPRSAKGSLVAEEVCCCYEKNIYEKKTAVAAAESLAWPRMAWLRLLRALGGASFPSRGKALHAKMLVFGSISDVYAANDLMTVYVRCGRVADVRRVFDHMPAKNLVSWTILISAYARLGPAQEALAALRSMVCEEGFAPNDFTYVGAISACAAAGAAKAGREIHGRIYRVEGGGGARSHFVSNALINMYCKSGELERARKVFDEISLPNSVSWCSIISGCCRCGEDTEALRIFSRARRDVAAEIDTHFVLASVLGACASLDEVGFGEQLHCHVIKCGLGSDKYIEAGMVHLYAKCGEVDRANRVFSELQSPSLASWTALLGGYVQMGQGQRAMALFSEMCASSDLAPNEHTLSTAVLACSDASAPEAARQLHSLILKSGYRLVGHVGNALVDGYAKCGSLEESNKVFGEMEERDVVSWNSLIAGYARQHKFEGFAEALKRMQLGGVHPNLRTYSHILSACGDFPSVAWGKQTHARVMRPGFDGDVVVGSSLVDMYAKCGRLADARKVFCKMAVKNLVSWNSMVVGYAQHGLGKEAVETFDLMQKGSIMPNDVTFLGVLSACAHVGLVEEGERYFDSMTRNWGMVPRIEHYACMVDLFARAGKTARALEFIRGMPLGPNKVIWRSLLGACRTHGHLEMGRYAAECMLEADPSDVSARVMLFDVYADSAMWDEGAEVRGGRGPRKAAGCSWIEGGSRVHSFTAGDVSHEQHHEISHVLCRFCTDDGCRA